MQLEKLEAHSDERGIFAEAFKLPNDGQISYASINPGEVRGNHYHTHKIEYFLVVAGEAQFQIRDRKNDRVAKVMVNAAKPIVVKMLPNHTHNIGSKYGCVFIVWCNEQFDPANPDTFGEEI